MFQLTAGPQGVPQGTVDRPVPLPWKGPSHAASGPSPPSTVLSGYQEEGATKILQVSSEGAPCGSPGHTHSPMEGPEGGRAPVLALHLPSLGQSGQLPARGHSFPRTPASPPQYLHCVPVLKISVGSCILVSPTTVGQVIFAGESTRVRKVGTVLLRATDGTRDPADRWQGHGLCPVTQPK